MSPVSAAFGFAVFVIGILTGGTAFSQESQVVREYLKIATDPSQLESWLEKNESKILSKETARATGGRDDAGPMIEILRELGNEIALDSPKKTKAFLSSVIRAYMVANRTAEIQEFVTNLPRETQNECLRIFKTDDRRVILKQVAEIYLGSRDSFKLHFFDPGSELEWANAEISGGVRARVANLRQIDETFAFEHPAIGQFTRLLAANSLSEVDFYQPGTISTDLFILIRNLPDIKSRRRAFDKVMELVEQELDAGEWHRPYYDSGGSHTAEEFFRILSRPGQDWYEIALLADLLWNDPPRNFSISLIDNGIRRALLLEWEKAKSQTNEGQVPAETLVQFLKNFRKVLPEDESTWGDPVIFRPIFFEACGALNDPVMVGNLISQIESSASKDVLLHEFALGGRMWLSVTGDAPETFGDPTPWAVATLESLNGDLTHAMRTFVGHRILFQMEEVCPASLKWKFAEDLATTMNADGPANGYYVGRVLRTFNGLERDEKWNELADQLIKGWAVKNQIHEDDNQSWRAYHPLAYGTIGILELYFLRGDLEGAREFIKRFEPQLRNQAGTIALLIREGEHETAALWLEGRLNAGRFVTVERHEHLGSFKIAFDEKLSEQLASFLPTLNDEQQLFARLLVESLPEGPNHEERIDDLATAVSDYGVQSDSFPIEPIKLLARYAYASEKAVRVLEYHLTETEISMLFSKASGIKGTESALRPAILLAIEKLRRENDPSPLVDLIEKVETSLSDKDKPYGWGAISKELGRWFISDLETLPANTKKLTSGVMNQFVGKVLNARFVPHSSDLFAHQSVVASLADPSALEKWEQGLTDAEVDKLTNFRKVVSRASLYPLHKVFPADLKQRKIAREAVRNIAPWEAIWRLMED